MTPEKTIKDHEEEYHGNTPVTWFHLVTVLVSIGAIVVLFLAICGAIALFSEPQKESAASTRLLNIDCGNGSNIVFSHDTSLAHIKEVCQAYATTTYLLP